MSDYNKILKISIIVIMLSVVISIISISKLRIDKPVFLNNYLEVAINEYEDTYSLGDGSLILQYISNVDDNKYVTGITFKELPNTYFYASEYDQFYEKIFYDGKNKNINEYGRYGIHTVGITCPELKYEDNQKEIVLTNATVEFNDGSNMDIDLGKIVLYKDSNIPTALEGNSYTASSNGTASTTFRVKENVKIEKVESALYEECEEMFDFNITYMEFNSINEVNYEEGQTIKDNSLIKISSKYNGSDDILKMYTLYNISPNIYFINEHNDEYAYRYNNMESFNVRNYDSFYDSYGIYKYLKARGEL